VLKLWSNRKRVSIFSGKYTEEFMSSANVRLLNFSVEQTWQQKSPIFQLSGACILHLKAGLGISRFLNKEWN
jgi:hypothetical protein